METAVATIMLSNHCRSVQRCVLEDKSLALRILEDRRCGLGLELFGFGLDSQVLDNNTESVNSITSHQLSTVTYYCFN